MAEPSFTAAELTRLPGFQLLRRHYAAGTVLGLHAHLEAQLVYALSGVMRVETEAGRWLVPPQAAVWLPPLCPHAIEMGTDVAMFAVYYEPAACQRWQPGDWSGQVFALSVTALMRTVLAALSAGAHTAAAWEPARGAGIGVAGEDAGEMGSGTRAVLLARLLLDEVARQPAAPTFLPLPTSAGARRAALLALEDTACRLSLEALAAQAASSPRTLSRCFPAETGMSYKAWRQRARIVAAVDMLAEGRAIKQVAARTGFASTAAFSYSFRQIMGETPAMFRAQHDGRLSGELRRSRG